MGLSKLVLVFCVAVAAVHGCEYAQAPGTTVTVTNHTVVTTTVSAAGAGYGGVGGSGLLSANDRQLISSTWEFAKRDGDIAPKAFFNLFKNHPEYRKLFARFAKVPQSELMKNGDFLAQAYTILAGLNVVIQSIGSQELVAQELSHLGSSHFDRGLKVYMFEQFGQELIKVLEEELGSRFSPEAKDAWQNGYRAMVAGIAKSLKKSIDVPHPITGLTPHQIEDIRRTWANFRNDRVAITNTIFKKIFQESPSAQKKFAKFAEVPIAELTSNADFVKQSTLVADRFDNMIATMDNTLQIMGQIEYMGHSHKPRGIDRQRFDDFTRHFYDILVARGVARDDVDSWKEAFGVIVDKIANIMN